MNGSVRQSFFYFPLVRNAGLLTAALGHSRIEMFEDGGSLTDYSQLDRVAIAFLEKSARPEDAWGRVAELRGRAPAVRIVALGPHGSEQTAVDAFRAGVHDYLFLSRGEGIG
jgi:DNA-binding NtrC family response regulator